MKKYVNGLVAGMAVKAKIFKDKFKNKLKDNSGNWVEEAIKYIGAVVIGLIFIRALVLLFRTEILQGLKDKITEIFNIK